MIFMLKKKKIIDWSIVRYRPNNKYFTFYLTHNPPFDYLLFQQEEKYRSILNEIFSLNDSEKNYAISIRGFHF